jgi:hypothetical protein
MQLAREAAMKAVEEKYRENKKNVEKMKELVILDTDHIHILEQRISKGA